MKKLIAILLTVVLSLSCITFSVGAVPADVIYYYGDMNTDGLVTIEDVTAVQRYLAEMVTWLYDYRLRADYNHDDKVSVKDVTEMQRAIAEFPQPEDYGGTLTKTRFLYRGETDYLSGSMPAGTPVTFTVDVTNYQPETYTYVLCVNNVVVQPYNMNSVVVQPYNTSSSFTYIFTEPGYYSVKVYALYTSTVSGRRFYDCYYFDYTVPENKPDTSVRINNLRTKRRSNPSSYFVQYGAIGGTGPYTYEVTMINRNPEIYDKVIHIDTGGVFDWYTDIERFTDYSQTHETPWQLQYNTAYEGNMYPDYAYYFHLDFSAEDELCIDMEMLDFENCDYELIVRAKDAQGVLSNPMEKTILSLYRA